MTEPRPNGIFQHNLVPRFSLLSVGKERSEPWERGCLQNSDLKLLKNTNISRPFFGSLGWIFNSCCSLPVVHSYFEKGCRDNPERYCGWFWVHCSSKKFERMAREAMDICLRVLKESNKSRFDSYQVRNSVLIISHITFRNCRAHIFSDNLSRNSCIQIHINPRMDIFSKAYFLYPATTDFD